MNAIKRHVILNVGLMRLEARVGGEVIHTINMVTHVSRDKEDENILKKLSLIHI